MRFGTKNKTLKVGTRKQKTKFAWLPTKVVLGLDEYGHEKYCRVWLERYVQHYKAVYKQPIFGIEYRYFWEKKAKTPVTPESTNNDI